MPDGADEALADLQARKHLGLAQRTFGGKAQEKPLALRKPRLDLFTGPEIAHVDEIISRFWGATATAMSNLSHEFSGWQIVGMGKAIPYELTLIDDSPLTEDDLAYADELVKTGRPFRVQTLARDYRCGRGLPSRTAVLEGSPRPHR